MYRVIIDGKEIGKYSSAAYAKKIAETELELGAMFAEIYKYRKLYAQKRWNGNWR